MLAIYFVEFLDKHADGLAELITFAIFALLIVGIAFALRKEPR